MRDILNKYKGASDVNVPTSWLDEIEGIEKSVEKPAYEEPVNANEATIDEFRDIMNIRKKYINLLGGGGATQSSNELSAS